MPILDLESWERALRQLETGLALAQQDPENELVRDGVIQRFEYTFELSAKMIKRFLEAAAVSPGEIDALGYRDLVRRGAEAGLLEDPKAWFAYREARNETSHSYDGSKADRIYGTLPRFAKDARFLLERIKERNHP